MVRRLAMLAFILVILVPLGIYAAGQLGMFSGTPPTDIGVHNGMLKAPGENARNVVSSQAAQQPHNDSNLIAPLEFQGDPAAAFARLQTLLANKKNVTLVTVQPDYIHAEFRTKTLKFVDDVEFLLDTKNHVIQMRSASRLGRGDFGVNRARLERIRVAFNRSANPSIDSRHPAK